MSPQELLSTLQDDGFELELDGTRLLIGPKAALTDELRQVLRANKAALIALVDPATQEQQRRAELLELAMQLGWPALSYKRGHTIIGGREAWEKFTTFPPRHALDEALEAALAILETASGKDQPCLRSRQTQRGKR